MTIPQPTHVDIKTLSQEAVEVTWEEPTQSGQGMGGEASGKPIIKYRLFVQEKDSQALIYSADTSDNRTQYKLKTPPTMYGKDYIVTV